jgi:peptidoglycan glycosyltransferase
MVGFLSFQFGASGLESTLGDRLTGEGDALDQPDNLIDYLLGQPQPGSVRLTLDTRVQDAAQKALGDQRGAVAAINPKTGAIYALWSNPSYDPNPIASHDQAAAKAAFDALDAGDRPGISRAFSETYPPGSTFKVVTTAAGLKHGITPTTEFDNPAVLDLPDSTVGLRNFGGGLCRPDAGAKVTLAGGFRQSCNTTFAQVALRVGGQGMKDQADLFGFDRPLPIEIGSAPSVFPEAKEFEGAQSSLAQAGIGQFDVRVTPLQMAMVTKAGSDVYSEAMSPQDAATIKNFMVSVVAEGTGTAGQIPGVTVGGKTGTAQTVEGAAPHAWFIAFAPAEDPVVAVAVVVENGGSLGSEATGGAVAAPVAKQVMETVLNVKPEAGG